MSPAVASAAAAAHRFPSGACRSAPSSVTIPVTPGQLIVIEGLIAVYHEVLRGMMSLKIDVDTTSEVQFICRTPRNITERVRSVESVVSHNLRTTRPIQKKFTEPTKQHADIIHRHGASGSGVDTITARAASVIGKLQRT